MTTTKLLPAPSQGPAPLSECTETFKFVNSTDGMINHYAASRVEPFISKDAVVTNHANVRGRAKVCGPASQVHDNAVVEDWAQVCGHAELYSSARISGHAVVRNHAIVTNRATVKDFAEVAGYARIEGDAIIEGNAKVGGLAVIGYHARLSRATDWAYAEMPNNRGLTLYRTTSGRACVHNKNISLHYDKWKKKYRRSSEPHFYAVMMFFDTWLAMHDWSADRVVDGEGF